MTAVAAAAGSARAGPRPVPLTALGEIALAAVGLAAVVGLHRVFLGSDWFPPLLLHVAAAHLTVTVLRRQRVDTATAVSAAAAVGFLVVCWVHVGHLTTFGIPTTATLEGLGTTVGDAFAEFPEVKAPTAPLEGFLVASAVAVWAGAIIGDWAAFRVGAAVEAVLPSAMLFGVGAVLGAGSGIAATGVWVAAVLGFVLFRRAERLGRTATWVGDRAGRGPRTLLVLGGLLTLAATLIAAAVGPQLPGARSEAIVSLTDIGDDGPGTRVTVSPLVDIRSRLVEQSDAEVFTVRSDVRSYWRLTSLEDFDGRIWSSNGSYGETTGALDDGVPVASDRITVTQQFHIRALAQIWLPAAYEPRRVQVSEPVRYDEVSGTLIVDTEVPTSDGRSYGVVSELPQHRPEALADASSAVPDDIAEEYLDLPDDFAPRVGQLASQIVEGSPSAYDASLRLQNFFRDEFTYDLDTTGGHGADAIESFVFEQRRGYCEQFAGSFAAMARSVGIPARVAVGFTPGVADPSDPDLYRVRGEHAHAWPEVYLGEYGWVAFEPTPGRGAPFAEQYTGVPEQQAESGSGGTTATTAASPPSTPTPASPTSAPAPFPDEGATPDAEVGTGPDAESDANPWFTRAAIAAAVLVTGVALYLVVTTVVVTLRRSRRRRAATSPTARVALAWAEALDALRRAGVPTHASETQSQTADRVSRRLPRIGGPLRSLASTVQTTAYAPDPPGDDTGHTALALADEIDLQLQATMTTGTRFRARFHPSRLVER